MANDAIAAILAEMSPEDAIALIGKESEKMQVQPTKTVDLVGSYNIGSGRLIVDSRVKSSKKYRCFFCDTPSHEKRGDCSKITLLTEAIITALLAEHPAGIVSPSDVKPAETEPKPAAAPETPQDVTYAAIHAAAKAGKFDIADIRFAAYSTERKTYYAWEQDSKTGVIVRRWHLSKTGHVRAGEAKPAGDSHLTWATRAKYVFVSIKGL